MSVRSVDHRAQVARGANVIRKIAVFLPDLRPGGAERMHVQMAREWLARGVGVDLVLCQAQGELLAQLPTGATVVDLQAARVRSSLLPLLHYLRHQRPGALVAAMWPLTVVAPLAARLISFSGTVVVSEHAPLAIAYAGQGGLHRLSLRASMALGYRLADVRIGVSSGVADDMAKLASMPRGRISRVHNPAASSDARTGHSRPGPLADVQGLLILTVGTLKSVKRHDLLLDAFARIAPTTDATLCILGEGQERVELEAQVRKLGLQGRVLVPGYASDPTPWYAHADLFVLSSDYEGFGNVIVEALEHGVPVVSTDCPSGPREILEDGKYGTLVPVGDADALAQAMLASLRATHDHAALKARARDFAVDKVADQYLDHLLPGWRDAHERTEARD